MKTKNTSTQQGLERLSNASEYVTNGEAYQVFPDKIEICQINLPQGIEYSKREKFLYSIGLTYLSLNQDSTEDRVYGYLSSINVAPFINKPVSSQSLTKIITMIFNKKDKEGELKVIPNKKRTIIFDDIKFNITYKEKMNIVNKENGLLKQQRTKQTINDAIVDWTGSTKITTAGIAASTGFALRTIKTYWPEFKEYVADLNKAFKSSKKDKVVIEDQVDEKVVVIEEKVELTPYQQNLLDAEIKFCDKRQTFDYYNLLEIDNRFNSVSKFELRYLIEDYRRRKYKTITDLVEECNKLIN